MSLAVDRADHLRALPARRMVTRRCLECGEPFAAVAAQTPAQEFCDKPCKRAFNNRRAVRGAVLYDLVMAWRCERGLVKPLRIWTPLCRLARAFRAEDIEQRAGRKSWRDPRDVIRERPWLNAIVISNTTWKRPGVK